MFGIKRKTDAIEVETAKIVDPIETIDGINKQKFTTLVVSQLVFSDADNATSLKSPHRIVCSSIHQNLYGVIDYHCRDKLERTIAFEPTDVFEPTYERKIMCMIDLHETDFMALWNEFLDDRTVLLSITAKFENDLFEDGSPKIESTPASLTFGKRLATKNVHQ